MKNRMPASAFSISNDHNNLIDDSLKMSNFDLINNNFEKINLNDDDSSAMRSSNSSKSQNITDCVPVPSSEHVAEIVGRQGCKIKALRAKTNTYIKTPIRGESPMFVITGRKEDVHMAKKEILSAAEHFSQIRARRNHNNSTNATAGSNTTTSTNSSNSTSSNSQQQQQQSSFTPTPSTSPSLLSSSSTCSSSSETTATGASVSSSTTTTLKSNQSINTLILPPSALASLNQQSSSSNSSHTNDQYVNVPGQITMQVRVPYRVVGLVVGPKGSTIKRIQQQTQTYIITPSRDKDPVFEITGLPDNVDAAKQDIETYIALRTTSSSSSTTTSTITTSASPSNTTTLTSSAAITIPSSSSATTFNDTNEQLNNFYEPFYPAINNLDNDLLLPSSTTSVLKSTLLDNEHDNLLASTLLTNANLMQKFNLLNNIDQLASTSVAGAATSSIWSSGTSTTTTTTLTTSPLLLDNFDQQSNLDSLLLNNDNFYPQQQQNQHHHHHHHHHHNHQQSQYTNSTSLYQTIRSSSSLSSSASSSCSSASVSLSSSQTNCGNLNAFGYEPVLGNEQQQQAQQLYDPFNDMSLLNDRFNFYNQQPQQQQQQTYNDDGLFSFNTNNASIMMQLLMQQQQQQQQQQFLYQQDQSQPQQQHQIISKCFLCNNKITNDTNDNLNNDMITYQTNKLCLNCAQNIAYQHTEQL